MKLKLLLPLFCSSLVVLNLGAATVVNSGGGGGASDHFTFDPSASMFSANELSLDLFGYTASRDKRGNDSQSSGPGVAVNYFFCENLGIAAETYADAFTRPYLLNALGEFRYPIPNMTSLCPYVIAGVGRQWTFEPQWLGHIGGGLEFRFNEKTGVFVDGRHVFCANGPDYDMVRFGFR